MRKWLLLLLPLLITPSLAVKYYGESYDVHITMINVSDRLLGSSLINLTFIDESLPFEVDRFYVEDLISIPYSMREAMNESPVVINDTQVYNWSILADYRNQQPLFRDSTNSSAVKILLVGNQPCHGDSVETCFGTYSTELFEGSMRFFNTRMPVHQEPYLVMRDIWPEINNLRVLANGSYIDENITELLNEIVPEALVDVTPPYTERLAVEDIPPLIHTSYELIFAQCGVEIENILPIIGELRNLFPPEFRLEYQVVDCDDYEYSDFALYLEKVPYVIEHPGLFNLLNYEDSSKIPILMYHSLENVSEAYPLFIMKSCDSSVCYAGEEILNLIGRFFGLKEHDVPNCVMGSGLYFDDICDLKLEMIFNDFRKDVLVRDALLRLNFLNRLNFILAEAEGSPLRYFPGFEVSYEKSIADFMAGDYLSVINDTEELMISLEDAGFWNSWGDVVWDDISGIRGTIHCDLCGDGCYGGPGLCCMDEYVYDAQCCFNAECGIWGICEDNSCMLNTEKIITYFADLLWWAGPPILIISLMLIFRKKIMNSYLRFVFNRMRKKGVREDIIYSRMFQRGYKKEHIKEALKDQEIIELKKKDSDEEKG